MRSLFVWQVKTGQFFTARQASSDVAYGTGTTVEGLGGALELPIELFPQLLEPPDV